MKIKILLTMSLVMLLWSVETQAQIIVTQNISCTGGNNGALTVIPPGTGTPPFSFLWGGGQVTQAIAGQSAGPFTCTVTDAALVVTVYNYTLTNPPAITGSIGKTDVTCNGLANGSAIAVYDGGTGTLTYKWNTVPVQNTPVATAMPSGTYTITVTDANACTVTASVTINQPVALSVTNNTITNVTGCNGNSNGAITNTTSGGSSPYAYVWNRNGSNYPATSKDLANIPAGAYTVTVTDNNGCTASVGPINVTQPVLLTITNATITPVIICNGYSNGAITNNAPGGGTGPYTYIWYRNGAVYPAATLSLVNIPAGTYSVMVTDNNGCTAALAGLVVTEPNPTTIAEASTNVTCFGGNNGSWTITPTTAGLPASTYSIVFNTAPPQTFLGVASGASRTGVNIPAGTFTATLTDVTSGCIWTLTHTFNQPTQIQGHTSKTDVTCFGTNTGSLEAVYSGGTGTLNYSWNTVPVQNTPIAVAVPSGTYTVTVTDGSGCTVTASTTINQPAAALNFSAIVTTPVTVCNGYSNGSITYTLGGGTAPYAFVWARNGNNYPATSQNLTNIPAGTYNVTVTDNNGCTAAAGPFVVAQPPALIITNSSITPVTVCNGNSNGDIFNNTAGGTGADTYTWTRNGAAYPAATQNLLNIPAGIYSVTVTDQNGCTATLGSLVVTEPNATTITQATTNINCFGGNTGSWTITPTTVGLPASMYSITFNTVPAQKFLAVASGTSKTGINIIAGTYTATVKDSTNGCIWTLTQTFTQPPKIQGHISKTDLTCNSVPPVNNGTANAVYSGGTGTLTYSWNTVPVQNTPIATAMPSGTYTVTVTDGNACTVTASVIINQPAPVAIVNNTITNVTICNGNSNGALTNTTSGGTAPYTYIWNRNGTNYPATSGNLANIPAGTYSVTATDNNGCTGSLGPLVVTQPKATTITDTVKEISCNNGSDGEWSIWPATMGAPGYRYIVTFNSVPPGPGTTMTVNSGVAAIYSNLMAGTYTAVVVDSNNGCMWNYIRTINQPLPIVVVPIVQENVCYGDTIGQIILQINGGNFSPTYTVNWTGPNGFNSTSLTISNLASGDYYYIVTDGNGCPSSGQVRINPLVPVQGYIIAHNILCVGGTGSLEAIYSGGSGYLNYLWSNNATTPAITINNPGTYFLTVTDSAGCQKVDSAIVPQPQPIVITLDSLHPVSCYGYNDGGIWLTTSGGTGALSYSWLHDGYLDPDVTEDIVNITAGVYEVTVKDAVGCTATATFNVPQPAQTIFLDSIHNISCNNGADGFWSIMPIGIDTPYVAIFMPFSIMSTDTVPAPFINNLSAGSYGCVITGASGCQWQFSMTLHQPLPITVGVNNIVPVLCYGDSTGSITLDNVHGGVQPYTYAWSNGYLSNPVTNIAAGIYHVTISDSLNCSIVETYEVPGPYEPIKFFPTVTSTTCPDFNNGKIVVNPEDIYWSPFTNFIIILDSLGNVIDTLNAGQSTGDLPAGTYTAILVNSIGCVARDTVHIPMGSGDCFRLIIPNMVTANGDGINDVFSVGNACDNDAFKVLIFTDVGVKVFESEDCSFAWDPRASVKYSSETVFYYYIKVTKYGISREYRNSINVNY